MLLPKTCPADTTNAAADQALAPVSDRVAYLLKPTRTVPRYSEHGYETDIELWEPRDVTAADVPALRRQLGMVNAAMAPGDPGAILARVLALLSHYRDRDPLPPAVEAAIAEDWADDLSEFPIHVISEAARRWRRHPTKYRFKPLPGDIRALCVEVAGKLPVVKQRLERLLVSVPGSHESTESRRASEIRARVIALAAEKRPGNRSFGTCP